MPGRFFAQSFRRKGIQAFASVSKKFANQIISKECEPNLINSWEKVTAKCSDPEEFGVG
jgi:hypothetical protein